MHLSLLGPEGLVRTAETSMSRAREAVAALTGLPGVSLYADAPYGYEFALMLPKETAPVIASLAKQKIIPGAPAGRWYKGLDNVLLTACTEKTTPAQITRLADALSEAL